MRTDPEDEGCKTLSRSIRRNNLDDEAVKNLKWREQDAPAVMSGIRVQKNPGGKNRRGLSLIPVT
jgi:hypothetical protein